MSTNLVKTKPLSDPARWIAIYPCYLNSKKTSKEGRKIPKNSAIENPTAQEIFDIVQSLGLTAGVEPRKMHPREPDRDVSGRIRVQLKKDDGSPMNTAYPSRLALLKVIAEMIPKLKSRQVGAQQAPATAASSGAGGKKNKKKK